MSTLKRIQREAKTVEVMIRHYCRKKHGRNTTLCEECSELLSYSKERLDNCPFHDQKTTCGKCNVHCYKPVMRKKIRQIMRYMGPRMLLINPIMALRHILDGRRRPPQK